MPASVHRIVEQLGAGPVAVCDATWQLLHWNALFAATFGDPAAQDEDGRNALIVQFERRPAQTRQTPAERASFEESLVADLRATTSRYPHDPAVEALLARLCRGDRFRELWERRSVGDHRGARKTIGHPGVGDIDLDSNVLTVQGADLRLVVYTPSGAEARRKLDLLSAAGPPEPPAQPATPSASGSTAGAPARRSTRAASVIVQPESTRSSTSSTGPDAADTSPSSVNAACSSRTR
ncbi:hypothetical protein J2S41_006318 [Catenuloplanes atrovinosus]|uniref:MmyB-like transcription regulator ligand binding domain-containing protein n=1 Tax=Catenuloplanes atrovinosus TaxID=137266 RepID=A0AAE4CFE8_9ACTN|nr:hypothetical protein [Catenuloplanes atrovinosus]